MIETLPRKTTVSAMPASAPTGRRSMPGVEQLRGAGCTKIYREKVTGAHSDRRKLLNALASATCGNPGRFDDIEPPAK